MDPMSEVQEKHAAELAMRAAQLIAAEAEVAALRALLHQAIWDASNPALGEDKMGPSAIARATGHKYTREYVTELLKKRPGGPAGERNARSPRNAGNDPRSPKP